MDIIKKRRESFVIFTYIMIVFWGIAFINNTYPNDYQLYSSEGIYYDKGIIVEIISENVTTSQDFEGWKLGSQELWVEFTSGIEKSERVVVKNSLSSTHNVDVSVGSKIIVKADRPEGITPYYTVYNYDRTTQLWVIVAIFVLFMGIVGKIKGLKSVFGLSCSLYIIMCFLLPAIYRGWSPIYMTLITVLLVSSISLLLLNGFCEKTYTAVLSTMIGVGISTLFFLILEEYLDLSGYNLEEAETLILIARNTNLQIKEVFFSAVMISSLGAVIDTTMSIAASIYEIREVNPTMKRADLFRSGISIGEDMIGTMCQTLILAFVGSSLSTFLVLISYGTQVEQFISSNYIAIEIVQAFSGSMAILFAVPITAFLSCYTHGSNKTSQNHK